MRIAAMMPTRDRAATAYRAASTFLEAISRLPEVQTVSLVIADDSSRRSEIELLQNMVANLGNRYGAASVTAVRAAGNTASSVASPHGGPGRARNCSLAVLRDRCVESDVTILLDDDVSFTDVVYRGAKLRCDGSKLIADALLACRPGRTIAGCGYVGRQDLSMLEHARLASQFGPGGLVTPSVRRADVENVAPGGISTAFLTLAAPPTLLPPFPEHYNEDYIWLHAFERAGWSLKRVAEDLIHAPPGDVAVTPAALSFQIYGEIVWLAVLECARYPVDDFQAMAAAVDEIAGDIRAALVHPPVSGRAEVAFALREVLKHYELLLAQFGSGQLGTEALRLLTDIRKGLALAPQAW